MGAGAFITAVARTTKLGQSAQWTCVQRGDDAKADAVLSNIRRAGVILCVRTNEERLAYDACCAAVRGGMTCVEITLTTPNATDLIQQVSNQFKHVCIGAGTVLNVTQARDVISAGAKFVMSPVTDGDVIEECVANDVVVIPGAATPTECTRAIAYGAQVVKLFPVSCYGGMELVRGMKRALPHVKVVPTSGIELGQVWSYLSLQNVVAVGCSSQVLDTNAMRLGKWDEISRRARLWSETALQKHII